jgi:hypothetical protein
VQERSAVHADVDERGLHAGQHARHLSEHDVAHGAAGMSALDLKLGDDAFFDQSDAGFTEITIDDKYVSGHALGELWSPPL